MSVYSVFFLNGTNAQLQHFFICLSWSLLLIASSLIWKTLVIVSPLFPVTSKVPTESFNTSLKEGSGGGGRL